MKVPRICTNPGCLFVLKPTKVEYVQGEGKEEENAKLDVIDAQRHCPKCNSKLTKYIHKVWDLVKDNEEITKQFGMLDKEAIEKKQKTYKEAREFTEAQLEKDIIKYKKAV